MLAMASAQAAQKSAAANPRRNWPAGMEQEMEDNRFNPIVGSTLVSETDKLRVWHLLVPAGSRCTFHRHVLDYFWTCHSHGKARNYFEDGSIAEVVHYPGHTRHMHHEAGKYLLHSVENIGDTDLLFTTVEFLQSANEPLPIPDGVRMEHPA
jgi:beta-alanine degradation protein BauB